MSKEPKYRDLHERLNATHNNIAILYVNYLRCYDQNIH